MGIQDEKKEDVAAYKNELKNLEFYRKKRKEYEDKKEAIEYEMAGVKGVDYSKQKGSYNESAVLLKQLALSATLDYTIEMLKMWAYKEQYVKSVLNYMEADDRDLVLDVIVRRKTFRKVCNERNIPSTSSLLNRMNQIIAEALEEMEK